MFKGECLKPTPESWGSKVVNLLGLGPLKYILPIEPFVNFLCRVDAQQGLAEAKHLRNLDLSKIKPMSPVERDAWIECELARLKKESMIGFVSCPGCTWVNHLAGGVDKEHSPTDVGETLKSKLSERFGVHRNKIHPHQVLEAKYRVMWL